MKKTIVIIVGIIVVAFLVQFGRFYSAKKDMQNGEALVLPVGYFPFNGTYSKQNNVITKG